MAEKKETERNGFTLMEALRYLSSPVKAIMEDAARAYAQPLVSAANDLVRRHIVVPTQKALGMEVKSPIKTENNYSNRFLDELDKINIEQLDKQVPDWRERTEIGDTVKIGVKGGSYVDNYGGTSRGVVERTTKPRYQVETTLGSYDVYATKDKIITKDPYDWDTKVKLNDNNTFGRIRNFMGKYGTPDYAPDNEKIHTRIESKRTK